MVLATCFFFIEVNELLFILSNYYLILYIVYVTVHCTITNALNTLRKVIAQRIEMIFGLWLSYQTFQKITFFLSIK